MSELAASYRSLPLLPKVVVTGVLAVAALVVIGAFPHVFWPLIVIGVLLTGLSIISLPFVAIGLIVYATARALAPRPHMAVAGSGPGVVASPVQPAVPAAPADAVVPAAPSNDLPPEAAAQVARIQDKATVLRAPEKAAFLGVEDRQHLDQIEREYLPNALSTYRALPSGSTDWTLEATGETAGELLDRQLHLFEENLDAIARRVFEAGAAQLIAQQQFLEERFRPQPPPSEFDLK